MPLFEVAIIQRPTKKEIDEGTGVETLVFGPKPIIARDQQSAAVAAVMDGGVAAGVDRTRMDILVRPFA